VECPFLEATAPDETKINCEWQERASQNPMQRLFAKFARSTPYGGLVSMLFAVLRRRVFQSRCITVRPSDRGSATEVMFAHLFGHG